MTVALTLWLSDDAPESQALVRITLAVAGVAGRQVTLDVTLGNAKAAPNAHGRNVSRLNQAINRHHRYSHQVRHLLDRQQLLL